MNNSKYKNWYSLFCTCTKIGLETAKVFGACKKATNFNVFVFVCLYCVCFCRFGSCFLDISLSLPLSPSLSPSLPLSLSLSPSFSPSPSPPLSLSPVMAQWPNCAVFFRRLEEWMR